MGFGFVNFETNDAALTAMNAMNGAQLPQGKVMKISLARPAWKANIHSNVYVSGLPLDFTEQDILNIFVNFASQVENIRKLRDSRGIFRGIAVIRFDKEELAIGAMKALNGYVLPDGISSIQIRPWRPEFRPERIDSSFTGSGKSLSPTPSPHGFISLATPSPTGASFANTSLTCSLTSPVETPNAEGWQEIWSKYVEAQMKQNDFSAIYSQPIRMPSTPSLATATTSLFVFHLPPDANESTLRVLFEPFGSLVSVRVLPGKGYGFVNFDSVSAAMSAVTALNGYRIGSKHLKVEFKKSSPTTPMAPTVLVQ